MMKVLAFNGSPHPNGVIGRGLAIMEEELESAGIETELIHVGAEKLQGCVDCRKCRGLGRCVFNDDPVNYCAEKLKDACGLILASPVYYGGIAGTFKAFLDRLFFPGPDLRYKVGAAAASLRRSGGIGVYQQLNNYLNLSQVIIAPSVYWNVIHGNSPEELEQDLEGLQILRLTARNMAWLIKTLAAGRELVPYPQEEKRVRTNFIH